VIVAPLELMVENNGIEADGKGNLFVAKGRCNRRTFIVCDIINDKYDLIVAHLPY
jgi:hypothetical protein